ncbi:MAG: asparagine synthase (glutamine-hydrolyzing) [Acidimicrobiales bacterium]
MCGIAGVVGPGARVHAPDVRAMVAFLEHRGPDEHGIVEYDGAVLGSSRLSIIDVAGGHQPLLDAEQGTGLVCNGEIYGHRRLRAEFADHRFATGSDCEVILPMYARYGAGLLDRLPGTFAFALWDDRRRRLLLARDRFGERPLYWTMTADHCLAFASESGALVSAGLVDPRPDPEMISQMLRQGYVPADRSIWQGVNSVPHAGCLEWDLGKRPVVRRWWSAPTPTDRRTVEEAVEWFRGALDRAVDDQLDADVPVGAFLSGGVDSATTALLAARHHPRLQAFAFDMPGASEVPYATALAQRHDIDLHVYRPDVSGIAERITGLGRIWDEPFGDSSALPTSMLCEFAREHVTVVLTGDGADELLGGYLVWARRYLDDPAGEPAPAPSDGLLGALRSRIRAGRAPAPDPSRVARRYAEFRQYFDAEQLAQLGLPAVDASSVDVSAYHYATADDISRFDLDHYLPGDILVKTDRASMAHGLEVRSPFLDVEVAEGCLALPSHHKVDATHEKVLLRRAFADQWPDVVRDRPKQGFGAPMSDWLALPDVTALKRDLLVDPVSPLFELVERDAVQQFVDADDQRTWNLLMLGVWWAARGRPAPTS